MKTTSTLKWLSICILLLFFSNRFLSAQAFMPFAQSNYAGISGIFLQPASIADSRYKTDIVLFGAESGFNNNYISIDKDAFFKTSLWEEEDFVDKYLVRDVNGKDKSVFMGGSVVFPSFMVNLGKNSALAFSSRVRVISNLDNITEDLAQLAWEGFDYEPLLYKTLENANFNMQSNAWLEFGITYAGVLLNRDKHFLKAGGTLKYLQGAASGYAFVRDLTYRLDSPDTLSLFQSKVNYGISNSFDSDGFPEIRAISEPGIGFDVGIVYEYRRDIDKYTYSMDGKDGLQREDKDKYLFRVGISLIDFGHIKYQKGYYSQDFVADVRDWRIEGMEINSIRDFNDTLRNRFNFSDNTNESFKMGLPTALSLQLDYNIGAGFYVNLMPYFALRKGTNMIAKTHYYTSYSLTPRYDHKWFGVAVPLNIDQFNRFNAGLSLRLGPIWLGSNSIISNAAGKQVRGFDAYAMLKIPIFKKGPRDKDNDAVSDKLDKCPEIPGVLSLLGCPDTDGDGITDAEDECPYDKGPAELKGCPDRDGDGIADKNDLCPDHPGLPQFSGCPDTDGDGIVDHLDECPDQAGLAEFNGCPDRDGDGIPDKSDLCPDVPGKPEFGGCPFADSDKDGVPDEEDECPTIPGPAAMKGCPDTDGDGISDKHDLCPTVPGVPENKGCPVIEKKEQEILDRAFANLEFESGKSIIKTVSYSSLNELAALLIDKKAWKVQLSGHTDNTGKPENNMTLSKNRTQAVKDYLIKEGVEEFRIRTEWFGQEKPIADNKTPAGRQKNRRVEMKIVFE
jgi:outer membrane protein OmpA-like peptidoglycan-associated protein